MRLALRSLVAAGFVAAVGSPAFAAPTFSKDVAPILYKNCVECHRPTAMAPMSLMTFEDARPWARAIKQKVVRREMPPWGADPTVGQVLERRQPEPGRHRHDCGVGGRRRAEGNRAELPKAPHVRRRLVDRPARPRVQDDQAVHRAG